MNTLTTAYTLNNILYIKTKIFPKKVNLFVLAVSKNGISGKKIVKKYIFFNLKNK